MNKKELLTKLKEVEGLSKDEKAYLTDLINTKKKYGLVWEDKAEAVEEELRHKLPILKEVKDRAIINDTESDKNSNHILIEGDNLHALTALTFTHENKIDLIYIDPPYNTGKAKEFKYNDKYVDNEDSFRHSKWLSFMNKRLRIAHKLLADDGVMVMSIDDHEVSQIKLLCDEIFNSSPNPKASNQIGFLIWDLGTGTQAGHFVRAHEYLLVYAKDKSLLPNFKGGEGIIKHSALKRIGVKNPASEFVFPKGTRFDASDDEELVDSWGGAEKSYLIKGRMIAKDGKLNNAVTLKAGWAMKNQMHHFFYEDSDSTYDSKGQKVIEFYFNRSGVLTYRKEKSISNPPSVIRETANTKQGSSLLKQFFDGEEPVQFVKPIQLIKWFLQLMPEKNTVLDFFAGSGTTLHSVMEQNKEDGLSRKGIIVTNNENQIAEKVAYVRNKKVIEGYDAWKGEKIEGLPSNNLRYYKCDFVDRAPSLTNKRKLTRLATELLCIKDDCYTNITSEIGTQDWQHLFTNGNNRFIYIVYDDLYIEDAVNALTEFIKINPKAEVKVYVFSNGTYPYTEEFEDIANNIRLAALPDAIYKAYQTVLPAEKREDIPELKEEPASEEETNLFNAPQ